MGRVAQTNIKSSDAQNAKHEKKAQSSGKSPRADLTKIKKVSFNTIRGVAVKERSKKALAKAQARTDNIMKRAVDVRSRKVLSCYGHIKIAVSDAVKRRTAVWKERGLENFPAMRPIRCIKPTAVHLLQKGSDRIAIDLLDKSQAQATASKRITLTRLDVANAAKLDRRYRHCLVRIPLQTLAS